MAIVKNELQRAWNYRQAIVARIDAQTTKGIEKYGQTLEHNPAGVEERLEHLAQELTDGLAYIEWVKEGLSQQPKSTDRHWLSFPPLHPKLYADLLSQNLQVTEEAGELAEKVGLLTGSTGKRKEVPADIAEQVISEAIDVAQAACGVAYAVAYLHKINLKVAIEQHIQKMKERGYLINGD